MPGDRNGLLLPPRLKPEVHLPARRSSPHTRAFAPSKALSWRAKRGREPRNPTTRLP